jgi:NAD(P)H dehydrogenase (quinone)
MAGDLIGLTGVTGAVGGRVLDRLRARGIDRLRLVARDPARVRPVPNAELRQAEYADSAAMTAALAGVHTLFLVPATESRDRVQDHHSAVDAAVAAGVERIVYLSFLGAAPDATFTFARDHFHTEQRIKAAGVPATFLRMSLFLDPLPTWVGDDGTLRGPAGQGRVAWVARDDVAAVATRVLLGSGHDGATYDVTGPEALTLAETAQVLSAAMGRPVRYHEETLPEAYAAREPTGAPAWAIEGWVSSYAAIATGELATVSDTVPRLTGHPALTVAGFLAGQPST